MKKFLILLLILGCKEPDSMTISEASEIQFFPVGTPSFNLDQQGYTENYCFHQKFLCTGTRRFQGYDNKDLPYNLQALGSDGSQIGIYPFTKKAFSLYLQTLTNAKNDTSVPDSSSHQPWTLGSSPTITIASPTGISAILWIDLYGAEASTNYNFDFDITRVFGVSGSVTLLVADQAYHDTGSGSPLATYTTTTDIDTFSYTGSATIPKYIGIKLQNGGSGSSHVNVNSITLQEQVSTELILIYSVELIPSDEGMCDSFVSFKIFDGPDPETDIDIYYSDSVEFVSEWSNAIDSGRVDIQFKSVQNFADLIYDFNSPYFSIQLDGRFRKERKVTAQKVLELTEIVLSTATSVKKQRKLMITDVPDYMHTKICAILAHAASGSVLVDGYEVSLENEYEEGTDRPETYNQSPAEIWLTIKDYYRHNVT